MQVTARAARENNGQDENGQCGDDRPKRDACGLHVEAETEVFVEQAGRLDQNEDNGHRPYHAPGQFLRHIQGYHQGKNGVQQAVNEPDEQESAQPEQQRTRTADLVKNNDAHAGQDPGG